MRRAILEVFIFLKNLAPCGTDGRLLLSGFQLLVTVTVTLDRVIRHTVMHHPSTSMYIMSQKNVPPLACYNFGAHEWIFIFFGRNVTDKVGATWQNAETRKSHISLNWIVLRTIHLCAIFLKEKIVICDVFDSI